MPSAGPDDAPITLTTVRHAIGEAPIGFFCKTLDRLGYRGAPIGLAVSGGPDSVALLLLSAASLSPESIFVATVDHGLRPESAAEARQVAVLCDQLALRHATLRVTVSATRGGLQSAAREARYAALADWCPGRWLLTAHHRDDVAEGLLMRLRRGSGVTGLARMREIGPLRPGRDLLLVRPLLDWSKADLLGICTRAGIRTIHDPSNDDPRFDRTAARTILARTPWLDPRQLAQSATNLADAEGALQWAAHRIAAERIHDRDGAVTLDARDLPHDIKRRLVETILTRLAGPDPERRVEGLVRMLDDGSHGMLADIQAIPGPVWTFRPAPPRRSF